MTGLRPAGHPWTPADDDMLRNLLTSGMKQRLIAQKMKRSIGAVQTRIDLFKKPTGLPKAVDVPFLITASELRDRKNRRRRKQDDLPGRSGATRRLLEGELKVKTPERPVSKPGRRLRAQELATKAIEKIIDPTAPADEHAQRRRHLTKSPSEFREDRVDLPKPKR